MNKKMQFNDGNDGYPVWMEHSKSFFALADEHLKDFINQEAFLHPEKHIKQIQAWLSTLQSQWQATYHGNKEDNPLHWQMINKMYQEATELLLKEWMQRAKSDNPIVSIHGLYELWLASCQHVYHKTQPAYAPTITAGPPVKI